MNRELLLASAGATESMVIVGSTPNGPNPRSTTKKDWDASEVGYLGARHKNLEVLGEWDNHILSGEGGGCGCYFHTDLLSSLPDEIIYSIFTFLDISDLHALTKVASFLFPSLPHIINMPKNQPRPPTDSVQFPWTLFFTVTVSSRQKVSFPMSCPGAHPSKLYSLRAGYTYHGEI